MPAARPAASLTAKGLLSAIAARLRHDPDYDPDPLLTRALARADTPGTIADIAGTALDLARHRVAMGALSKLPESPMRAALDARAAAMWAPMALPAPRADRPAPAPGRIAYVLYSSLPYLSTGYALRSHALAQALRRAGADIHCLTRPGFPWDERPETLRCPPPADASAPEILDTLPYHRLPAPLFGSWPNYPAYVAGATEALIDRLTDLRPALVMAASSHACALPALRAARALGLPFLHDMRGMWELSRAAREPAFLGSPQFHYERAMETVVARQADHVFALSPTLRDAMIARGVAPERISFLPNGCDPARFGPEGRSTGLRARLQIPGDVPVIGYAGSFPAYEGLEDLISAAARLKARGHRFRLVLVGDESGTGSHGVAQGQWLMQQAEAKGVADRLLMTGRVAPDQVDEFMDLFDLVVVPRRPLPVTEMVAPLKPVEAMAAGKALVISSVGGMTGLVRHEETGLIFAAGDVEALTGCLARLLDDPALRARLGTAARAEAAARFSWDGIAGRMRHILHKIS